MNLDVVTMDVYVKYVDRTNPGQWSAALATLMSQILSGAGGVVVDGSAYASSYASFPAAWAVNTGGSTGTGPRVFLNYMTFDKNYVPVADVSQTNYVRISTAAKETGTDIPHQKLTATVTVKQAGYMYIYYSNEESTTNYEAFFDDFTVTHSKSPVLQAEDYYPFGLVATGYRRENSTGQSFKYNGKELQDELGLGWLDYGARMYMPEIGRWGVVDPKSHRQHQDN
jgi:RHS repeat-associated protein